MNTRDVGTYGRDLNICEFHGALELSRLSIFYSNVQVGPSHARIIDVELIKPCNIIWYTNHLSFRHLE